MPIIPLQSILCCLYACGYLEDQERRAVTNLIDLPGTLVGSNLLPLEVGGRGKGVQVMWNEW